MKIIFSDIDGTFAKMGHIPPQNIKAVKELEAAGHRFVFVSGRGVAQIEPILKECNFDCDYIYGNGAGYRIMGENPKLEYFIDAGEYDQWEEIMLTNKAFYYMHTNKGIVMQPLEDIMHHFDTLQAVYLEQFGEKIAKNLDNRKVDFRATATFATNPFDYLRANPELKLIKFELLNGEQDIRQKIQQIATDLGYFAFSSVLLNLEIVPSLSNKGNGIQRYLSQFDHVEKTFGFGDAMNDLAMFEVVDCAVAMGDSSEQVKAICDITLDEEMGDYILRELL